MYVLGIDTATKVAGAAIVKDGRIISERFIHNKLTHSQVLLPMVDQVIADAGITVHELGGIAVTGGPGSFTGLRIGMAFAKTLAQVLQIPVTGVSTLQVLAANVLHFEGLICPILDARKQEVYTCIYRCSGGKLHIIEEARAMSIENLVEKLNGTEGSVIFLGDGVPVYFEKIQAILGGRAVQANQLNLYTRAGAVALLGAEEFRRGEIKGLTEINPVYLRRSEAEITWEKRRGEAENEKACCHDLRSLG
ncbi:tRNA (adenosine(37)-N6)-threonylcarbamoyltransferase complex dimerization subunit type 1 TsaB [Thermincola ferriacetica]|uniref:tRNA (adenosine(37)-N6)-threonylcarbamoyltransferase complex dimerization subunit type 1 TsaB n=1 Tax=Thermincola ferriacetica TaxID=281456 RepID=UPI0009F9B348|nr:tRNA (adenosine(37)-N6)-threonylcarbamoyltransferase complex dimerization subunit type 1 TsaB [Thermincola ferriacetica]